ncbi:squalene synthase HpnC [Rubripirellula amarantea]|nr:squalene synthase HpnC [Rubripirellula amarantea]
MSASARFIAEKPELVRQLTQELATLRQAQTLTKQLAKGNYENFLVGSVLLPKRLRQPFFDVYAFCRIADDLADESESSTAASESLIRFREQLHAAFAHSPTSNVFLALDATIRRFKLPQQPFDDLLDAFEQDQHKVRYANFAELNEYCLRSAAPVGRIVLKLAECSKPKTRKLSDHICVALQLANFWQDVARDYAMGRIYLPQDHWDSYGVCEAMFCKSSTEEPLRRLIASECDRAQALFEMGLPLADHVPKWLASDIKLFAHGGIQTLAAIRRIDYDVLARRPTVGKWTQLGLLSKAFLRRL